MDFDRVVKSFLFHTGPIVVFVWRNAEGWPIESVSENLETIYGYSTSAYTTGALKYSDQIHPDDLERVFQEVQLASANQRCQTFLHNPYRYLRANGDYRWVRDHTSVIRDQAGVPTHFIGYLIDITDEVETEKSLRFNEARFRSVFEQANAGIVFADLDGRVLECNQNFSKILGYGPSDVVGMNMGDFTHPYDHNREDSLIQKLLKKEIESYRIEKRFVTRSAEVSWVDLVVSTLFDESKNSKYLVGVAIDINDRKKSEDNLRENQKFLSDLIESAQWVIYAKDEEGKYLLVNKKFEEVSGISRQQAIGRTDTMLFPEEIARQFRIHDLKVMDEVAALEVEEVLPSAGGPRYFEASKFPIFNSRGGVRGVCGISSETTEKRKIAMDLDRNRQQLRDVIDANPNFVMLKNAIGKFLLANKAVAEFYGTTPRDMIGKDEGEICQDTSLSERCMKLAQNVLMSGETQVDLEEVMDLSTKKPRYFQAIRKPLKSPDGDEQVLILANDVTDLEHAKRDLEIAKNQAEAASRAKSEFLANMSHEIRTPLNGIIGFADIVLETDLNPNQRELLTKAKGASVALLNILNDILDYSKIEAKKLAIEEIGFDLNALLMNCRDLFSFQASQKGVRLIHQLEDKVPQKLVGDPLRLTQVLNNLVGNAIKFTEKGEIKIEVRLNQVKDRVVELKILVHDSGIGMTEEQQSRLFRPFEQADSSNTRKYGGTGLGLTISKQLVELMGGQIDVKSQHGIGSTFSFTMSFKVQQDKISSPVIDGEVARIQQEALLSKKVRLVGKVLLVEDNENNQMVAAYFLKSFGLESKLATNGLEAVQMALADDFDLILMDVQMPIMDGLEAARKIREFNQDIPIIALTAAAMAKDKEDSIAAGMNDHLAKPLDKETFKQVLARYLPTE